MSNATTQKSKKSSQIRNSYERYNALSPKLKQKVVGAAVPDYWVSQTLGESMWEAQQEIMRALVVNPRVAVASCNSAGKSFLAARVATWFLKTYQPSIVLTTAPTDRQVRRILWKEIHVAAEQARQMGNNLGGKLLTKEWQFTEEHFAIGFATKDYDATSFQGIHGPHVLVIADEAAGLSEQIWEGIYSVLRGQHTRLLAIGNPTSIDGEFYKAFSNPSFWTKHISAFDTPNVKTGEHHIPGVITAEDVEQARHDWGEESPLYIAKILGQFPTSMEDTLFGLAEVDNAGQGDWTQEEMDRYDQDAPVEIGADFARYGKDRNVFIARRGRLALKAKALVPSDLGRTGMMAVAKHLADFIFETGATRVKADAVGLGGGVPDRLREMQQEGQLPRHIEIIDVNEGGRAQDSSKFDNLGTEMWKGLADRIKAEEAFGPVFAEPKLASGLTRRKIKYLTDGRMRLESKDEMRRRGLDSPDWGDAAAFAFAENVARARPVVRVRSGKPKKRRRRNR